MEDTNRKDGNQPNVADEQTSSPQDAQGGETQDADQQGEPQGGDAQGHSAEPNVEPGAAQADDARATQDASKDDEIAELRDQLMRAQAEFENAEKRRAREAKQMRKYLMEPFMLELLEVKDNLERTVDALDEDTETRAGLTLTIEQFGRILSQNHVEEITSQGEVFNPELHEAMHMQNSDEYPANTIIQTMQKGYRLHERLLRPARVIVSSGKAQVEEQAQGATKERADAGGEDAPRESVE